MPTPPPLPPETAAAVRAALEPLVDGIVAAVRDENPVYAQVLEAPEGVGIRLGIEQAIRSFLDGVERGERPGGDTGEVWRRLGEAEFQAGRSLDALRSAWRTGTRAAWRGAAELAVGAGIEAPVVIALAEAIFVFTDELGTDVVEGYLRMQSDEAGERERRRRRIAALLLDSERHDAEAIEHAASLARWIVPAQLAALAVPSEEAGAVARRLDADALVGADPDGGWLLIPDPDGPGRAAAMRHATRDTPAALGPTVPARDAAGSLRWARVALELVRAGALPRETPTRVDRHLASVILMHERDLAQALVERRLGALSELPAAERERLLATLEAWLAHQRQVPKVAEELHVHPQTVRYRIGKLRELLGAALDDADQRFELEMALRAHRSLPE